MLRYHCPEGCLYVDWKRRKRKKVDLLPVDPFLGCLVVKEEHEERELDPFFDFACQEFQKEVDDSIIKTMMAIIDEHRDQMKEEGNLHVWDEEE